MKTTPTIKRIPKTISKLEDELLGQIRWLKLPEPEREVRFDSKRRYRFDFAWREHFLGVEVQGGIWKQGGHSRGLGHNSDCDKLCLAVSLGWRVLVVTSNMIRNGAAVGYIEKALKSAKAA